MDLRENILEEQLEDNPEPSASTSYSGRTTKVKQTTLPFVKKTPRATTLTTGLTSINSCPTPNQDTNTLRSTGTSKLKRSLVWNFYKEPFRDVEGEMIAECKLCPNVRTKCSGNTSNQKTHLVRYHKKAYIKALKERALTVQTSKAEDELIGSSTDESDVVDVLDNANIAMGMDMVVVNKEKGDGESMPTNCETKKKQLSIKKCFRNQNRYSPYGSNNQRKKLLDKKVIEFIGADFQPLSVVENQGFRSLISTLDPRYPIPSRSTVSKILLPKYFAACQKQMITILKNIRCIAITFDSWTSVSKHNYMAVTGHFIHNEKLSSCLLTFVDVSDSHTSDFLVSKMNKHVIEAYPDMRMMCAVTDNGSNMVLTCKKLNIKHVPCFLHTIQLVVNAAIIATSKIKDVINLMQSFDKYESTKLENMMDDDTLESLQNPGSKSVVALIKKCKRIVEFFNRSTKLMKKLRTEFIKAGLSITTLIQSVPTHWNSVYFMLERINLALDCINIVLLREKNDLILLTATEIQALPEIITILKPFADITDSLNGNSGITISLIIPYTSALLQELKEVEIKTEMGQLLRTNLIHYTNKRLLSYETQNIPSIATVLDPRFKENGFIDNRNYTNAVTKIQNALKERLEGSSLKVIAPSDCDDKNKQITNSRSKGDLLTKHIFNHLKVKTNYNSHIPTRSEVIVRLNKYITEPPEANELDVIQFWKNHEFKELADLALEHLLVPAGSSESERIFSAAENTMSKKRNRLCPERLKELLYLNKNMKFLEKEE